MQSLLKQLTDISPSCFCSLLSCDLQRTIIPSKDHVIGQTPTNPLLIKPSLSCLHLIPCSCQFCLITGVIVFLIIMMRYDVSQSNDEAALTILRDQITVQCIYHCRLSAQNLFILGKSTHRVCFGE